MSDIENLIVSPISKASARQRAGRAGRVRPYRLYTEEYFTNEMPAEGIPEIQRSNLMSSVIQLKALGIDNILGFHWPASPSPESLIRALEVLYSLGVFDDDAKLTSPTGFQVAEIPLTFSSYSLSAFCFKSMTTFLVLFSIGELLLFFTQAPVNYINLQCLEPSLRPLSMAMSTVAIHIFGDVPSSPLVGVLED